MGQPKPETQIAIGIFSGVVGIFFVYFSRYTETYCLQYYLGVCAEYEIVRPYFIFEPFGYVMILVGIVAALVGAVRMSKGAS